MIPKEGRIILISGSIESGKTTLCMRLRDSLVSRGYETKGLICPPVIEDGLKTGIVLVNVASSERLRLAVLRGNTSKGVFTSRWQFNTHALEIGNAILKDAVPCEILFIDELGPLEFERQVGWLEGLAAVDSREYSLAIVVVRPDLVPVASQRWSASQVLTVTRQNQDSVFDQIMQLVSKPSYLHSRRQS